MGDLVDTKSLDSMIINHSFHNHHDLSPWHVTIMKLILFLIVHRIIKQCSHVGSSPPRNFLFHLCLAGLWEVVTKQRRLQSPKRWGFPLAWHKACSLLPEASIHQHHHGEGGWSFGQICLPKSWPNSTCWVLSEPHFLAYTSWSQSTAKLSSFVMMWCKTSLPKESFTTYASGWV